MMLCGLGSRTQSTGADGAEERDGTHGHGKGIGINPESQGVPWGHPWWTGALQNSLACAVSKIVGAQTTGQGSCVS